MSSVHEVFLTWPSTDPTDVILTGTHDGWSESTHLKKSAAGFVGRVTIPWGTHLQYKWIVDGVWANDHIHPTEPDPIGNINNYYVAPPDPNPPAAPKPAPAPAPTPAPTPAPAHAEEIPLVVDPGEIAKPQTVEEFQANLTNHIKGSKFEKFFAPEDPFIHTLATKANALIHDPSTDLGKPVNIRRLTRLSLYQPVIYCDDSGSMTHHDRYKSQREIVVRIANIATKIVPDGLSGVDLRFINASGMARVDASSIGGSYDRVKPYGGTQIGTNLRAKILEPLVYSVINAPSTTATSIPFKRPLLVCAITDGCPSGEPVDTLKNVILECKQKLEAAGYDPEAVMFMLSQVGNDKAAAEFLKGLKAETRIKDVLYITTEQLDHKFRELKQNERTLETWLLQTLTKPIMERDD